MKDDITLLDIWNQQESYNILVRNQQQRTNPEWMINYILGTMTELTELLDETNWRTHRVSKIGSFGPNVGEELADITKYVFSMWQLMGFTEQDMLQAMKKKGDILNQLMRQELRLPFEGRNILMLDLDGVVADFRTGFMEWVVTTSWKDTLTIKEDDIGLHMDINNGWNYQAYNQAKMEFEKEGGYNHLPPISEVCYAIDNLARVGWYVIVYTARPYSIYKRIWIDTWSWLEKYRIPVHELHFGYDQRVIAASSLTTNNFVVAIEDDPVLIKRYIGCKIPVFIYPQPYNETMYLVPEYSHQILHEDKSWEISSRIDRLSRENNHII